MPIDGTQIATILAGLVNRKKKKGAATRGGYVPPVIPATNEYDPGTALAGASMYPQGPPPTQGGGGYQDMGGGGESAPDDSGAWLQMALSAIGGGPDKNAYVQPFEAAAGRATAANAAALPQIAAGYDRMRGELGTTQAGAVQGAEQAQAGMAGQQAQTQAQIAAMMAPVIAQIQAGGVGSLTGAMNAQVATGQAQIAQQGAAQTQLSQNLQQAGAASHQSRLADSQLAEQSAVSSANNNLSQVLNALDSRKADALKQYAGDSAQHEGRVNQAKMQAMDRQARAAERAEDREAAANDPSKLVAFERAQMALENDRLDLEDRKGSGPAGGPNVYKAQVVDWHNKISQSNPQSYEYITALMSDVDNVEEAVGRINAESKGGKVKGPGGKMLDANWLRDKVTELASLKQLEAEGDEDRLADRKSTRKRRG